MKRISKERDDKIALSKTSALTLTECRSWLVYLVSAIFSWIGIVEQGGIFKFTLIRRIESG